MIHGTRLFHLASHLSGSIEGGFQPLVRALRIKVLRLEVCKMAQLPYFRIRVFFLDSRESRI